ncbi:MAG: DNA helicase UvrD [Nitrospirae bacterium]|nr:DNA helicase UvrD [Nitrospirota bacterium]
MKFKADFHIHSPYSRATSPDMEIETLNRYAQIKGISVIGTGDFTHPAWFANIQKKLEPAEQGLFKLKPEFKTAGDNNVPSICRSDVRFILSAEISCIYSKNGRTRKVHNLLIVPSFNAAEKINTVLSKIGNLKSDGRPILGLDSKVLLNLTLQSSPDVLFVPAHAWTPHFAVLGSNSGFNSLEECFEELTPHIYAIETGLSSDPLMNWRLSGLDRVAFISNSDAHSPSKLAREANIFNTELSYNAIYEAIKTKDKSRFIGTIEYFPEEGKYHLDGHRDCKQRMTPSETKQNNGLCLKCGGRVTVGVMHRVDDLADRKEGDMPEGAIPFRRLIPLQEIIAEVYDAGVNTKKVAAMYNKLISALGNELSILQDIPVKEIEDVSTPMIAEGIARVRDGKVKIAPGYDGEYGTISIFE